MLARAARVALLVASCAAIPTLARAGAPREPRRVLILNSYHPGFQWTDGETSGVLAALGGSPRDIQVYVEYMGSKWASSPKYFRELRDAYATKYRDVRFDAIVATDDDALRFLFDYREVVFGEVPTVFCGVNDFHPAQLRGRRLYTGVNEVFDVRRSLDLALRLHPATRRIAVVSDSSISGRKIRDQFARGAREYAPHLAFEYLGERPLEEVLDRIAQLPSDSLVFHLVYFSDWRGKVIDNDETATLVSRAARVPVYGGWEFSLGHGIVGGKLLTGRDQGLLAGEMARRILAGARVDQVPVVMESQSRFIFDHEQLRRFGIREANLPAGSVILNAPPSFYALNKALVWGVLGGLGVLSIVVVLLQASRSRLQRMDEALRESQERLKLTVEATGVGTLHTDPYGGPAVVSHRFREMHGLVDDAALQDFEAFLSIVHPDDRAGLGEAVARSTDPAGDGLCNFEYRCVRPDGTVRWIAARAKTQFSEGNGVRLGVRFAAVTLDVTDRKLEEKALRESEERFRTLADNIPQHAFITDASAEFLWINRRFRDYSGDAVMGRGYVALIHPDHRGRVVEHVKRCLDTGETFEETLQARGTEGQYRWFLSRVVPLRDDAGNVVRWFGTRTDVTEQREVEEALRESEARARAILASLAEGVVLHDADGRVTTANEAAERLLGVSREEMTGHTVIDGPMLQLDGSPFVREEHPVTLALQTGTGHSGEFGLRRPDGSLVWLAAHAQPVRLPDGKVAGVVCSLFDVTQRRQALQRSEGHLRKLADSMPDCIVRFDRELRVVFANQVAAAAPPEQEEFWDQHLLQAFATGLPNRGEFGNDGPEGRHYESCLIPEAEPNGVVVSVLSITRDITDRKRAEHQLLASREQLRDLVARLNSVREEEKARLSRELHDEMGQLLTALRLELEVLEDRLADLGPPGEVRDLLDRAVAASELVTKTVQSMRSILSSLRPLALDRLGLDAALRQECRRFEEWAGVPCDFAVADGVSTFGTEADTALFRIAQEALTNVARHAGASRVAVRLRWMMGAALLQVEDDGRGIPAGHEPTGLGLLGMRERAERLGGDLEVKPGPRGGTTVEARIPSGAPTGRKDVS